MRVFLVGVIAVLCLSLYGTHSAVIKGNQNAALRMKREPTPYATSRQNGWEILSSLIDCVNDKLQKLDSVFDQLKRVFPIEKKVYSTNAYTESIPQVIYSEVGLKGRDGSRGQFTSNGIDHGKHFGLINNMHHSIAGKNQGAGTLNQLQALSSKAIQGRQRLTDADLRELEDLLDLATLNQALDFRDESVSKAGDDVHGRAHGNSNKLEKEKKKNELINDLVSRAWLQAQQQSQNARGGIARENNNAKIVAMRQQLQANTQVAGNDAINIQSQNARGGEEFPPEIAAALQALADKHTRLNNNNGNLNLNLDLLNFFDKGQTIQNVQSSGGSFSSDQHKFNNFGNLGSNNDFLFENVKGPKQTNFQSVGGNVVTSSVDKNFDNEDFVQALAFLASMNKENEVIEVEEKPIFSQFTNENVQDTEQAITNEEFATALAQILQKKGGNNGGTRFYAGRASTSETAADYAIGDKLNQKAEAPAYETPPVYPDVITVVEKSPVYAETPSIVEKSPVYAETPSIVEKSPVYAETPSIVEKSPVYAETPSIVEKSPVYAETPSIVEKSPVYAEAPSVVEKSPVYAEAPSVVEKSPVYAEAPSAVGNSPVYPEVTSVTAYEGNENPPKDQYTTDSIAYPSNIVYPQVDYVPQYQSNPDHQEPKVAY